MLESLKIEPKSGGLFLKDKTRQISLHPLWVRERVRDARVFDPLNNPVSYTHLTLPTKA